MALEADFVGQLEFLGDWGVLATDVDLKVTRWNRWLTQRTGLATVDVVGKPLFELFPDLLTRRIDRYYRQALTGQPVVLSQKLHRYVFSMPSGLADAGLEFMQQTVRIIPIMAGSVLGGTVTLIEDVTERVSYEADLRARALRQTATSALARTALAGGELEDVARALVGHLVETLGIEFVEVLEALPDGSWILLAGSGWDKPVSVVVEGSPPRIRAIPQAGEVVVTASVAAHPSFAGDEHLRAHGIGSGVIVRIPGRTEGPERLLGGYHRANRAFRTSEVEFVRALADILGLTVERKHLEEQLRIRVGELAEADRRKDDFLAMLAHELRNPLAPVRNGIQILRLAADKPEVVVRTREMIDRQVKHLSRLVDDLLDVSRITQGKVTLRTQLVDLSEVAGQAVEEALPLIEERRHRLTVSHCGRVVRLAADPSRLTQILSNLLTNAAKYTDEEGDITLTTGAEGAEAVCRVRDTGTGIAAGMLPRIFDLFTQVDGTLDRARGGLGIGLTLVKTLVELHGGRVEVFSAGIGKGSEFVVRLPMEPSERSQPSSSEAAGVPVVPVRILVVDDNVDSAESLAFLLSLTGHEVQTAHSGTKAIEVAETFRPAIVLLDIGLPGQNGYEVAQWLRGHDATRDALIIAMTGYGQEADRHRSHEAGFDEHLIKPIDPANLHRLIAERQVILTRP